MTKQTLWTEVYIEAMRQSRITNPKELADKAVKDYEERFEDENTTDNFIQNLAKKGSFLKGHTS